jgi:CheY-like chemotaxis protein
VSVAAPAAAGTRRLRFAVEDTGIGIAPALQDQLFKPFVQADSTQAQARGGSGLGLAISQRLVAAMGGRITLDSAPDRGSVFAFELSLPAAQADAPPLPLPAAAALRGRVLLVEDNAVNRVVAITMLGRLGLAVAECEHGLEAIAALRAGDFDLVLMDCQMPVLDGLAATRRIRAGEAGAAAAALPIVAVTAHALEGDAEECLAAGMNAYLSKPFTEADLMRLLIAWLPATVEATAPAAPGNR